jgi:hypothetical protein
LCSGKSKDRYFSGLLICRNGVRVLWFVEPDSEAEAARRNVTQTCLNPVIAAAGDRLSFVLSTSTGGQRIQKRRLHIPIWSRAFS